MKHLFRNLRFGPVGALGLLALTCLHFGCKGGTIPGSSQAAPHLDDHIVTDEDSKDRGGVKGDYSPYVKTGEMNVARYLHQVIRLKNGFVMASGGSDERAFSSLDSVELFDETTTKKDEIKPPSKTGVWFDTDFEGNPIAMEFRRLWHTMTMLPDNKIIVIGGAANFLKARAIEQVEVFDPDTRTFETLKDVKMVVPRVRHSANVLLDGTILITGGQIHDIFTDIGSAQVGGFGQSGTVTVQTQTDIFPSTTRVEVFTFRDMAFTELKFPDSSKTSGLTSVRGRAGHAAAPFAGPDNHINTGDDLIFLAGGFQTSLTPQLVPTFMVTRAQGELSLKNIEIYDPSLHIFSQVGTVALLGAKVNNPAASNLGIINDTTPDNVLGLGNVLLVALGDDNANQCWNTTGAPAFDEIFSATYTGFGPGHGLVFHRISYGTATEDGHLQNQEWETRQLSLEPSPLLDVRGRSLTDLVPLARNIESRPGVLTTGTWFFTGGGEAFVCAPPPCVPCGYFEGTIAAGVMFDPFYRLRPASDYTLDPKPNARDLKDLRNVNDNRTGVIGTWLALDGKLPSIDRDGFADVEVQRWAHIKTNRVYPALIAVAGEDGIINTPDDRVLMTGGGLSGIDYGGEASQPSCELVVIPKSPP